ncbi:hypothetical protein [Peptostreptococcus stomatis]|uniref:hypothetical protein n=1 Tax=Peptostreptococcus stomatis TaxID=341694 RepID=UPI0028D1210A|nr:hypothetical protein [Peptostreptococcus stomatis]
MKKIISVLMSLVLILSAVGLAKTSADEKTSLDVRIVTVADTVSYLVVDASKYESGVKEVYLDGVKQDFSSVDKEQKIVKREFDGSHSRIKVVLNNNKVVEEDISGIYRRFPYKYTGTGQDSTPEVVTGHAIMAVWDYHNVAKDADGKELTYPTRTTFDVDYTTKKSVDTTTTATPNDSQGSNPANSGLPFFKYGENIELEYDYSNKDQRAKFNAARKIYLSDNDTKKRLSLTKSISGDKAKLKISAQVATSSLKKGENELIIENKDKSTEKIKIVYDDKKPSNSGSQSNNPSSAGNPNPTEKADPRVFDYKRDLVFKYNLSNSEEKNKYDHLTKIYKLYTQPSSEAQLRIRKSSTSDGTGYVTISYNSSRPIQRNGKHLLKFYYDNKSPETETIYIKDKSPEVILTADSGEYVTGKSIIFNLKGFSYIFQQDTGIQTVYLNGQKLTRKRVINPDENYEALKAKGEDVAENEAENHWHVVGETFRIKNDGVKYLKRGVNYLTVQYDGYHDSNFKFVLNANPNAKANEKKPEDVAKTRTTKAARADVVTSATGGGVSKPSVGGDGGGSVNMPAKIAFKFDMVANAVILEKLSYDVASAKKLVDTWEGTSKEIAFMNGSINKRVVWDRYLTYVQNNRLNNGVYKTFAEYYNDKSVHLTQNGYYTFKYAFGNGLGAPIYNMRVYEGSDETSNPEKSTNVNIDVRFRAEGYTDNVMKVNDEAKFDIQNFNAPAVTSVDIIKPNKEKIRVDINECSYYKSLGMLSIKANHFAEAGEYTAIFHFDGANDSEVVFTVEQ